MCKTTRFVYLNLYAFLLLFCGIISAVVPLYKVSLWLIIPQVVVSLFFLKHALHLFSTWNDKMIKYDILIRRNRSGFHPSSFKPFMNAPCGRLLTRAVLKDLNLTEKYKELLVYKQPLIDSIKNGCVKQETKIYFGEKFQ